MNPKQMLSWIPASRHLPAPNLLLVFRQFLQPLVYFSVAAFFSSCATPSAPVTTAVPQPKTQEESFEVYKALPEGKALLSSPQFKVVDDFNSGGLKNRMGADWQVPDENKTQLILSSDKEDARSQQRGRSLKANFNLNAGQTVAFKSSLVRMDVSNAIYIAFKCRVKTMQPFSGRIRISFSDWRGKTVTQDVTDACVGHETRWGNVILPVSRFQALDLDQLDGISITVMAKGGAAVGDLGIDEIAFYGDNDVDFESHRDNLVGFPKTVLNPKRAAQLKLLGKINKKKFLKEIAFDTWQYFVNAQSKKTHLIVDHLRVGDAPLAADYTSPTNIAMDFMATIAACDLGFISEQQAVEKIQQTFQTLEQLERWKGFFFNYYDTNKLQVTRRFVSSVDSGWLAISLVVVRQAFPSLAKQATRFLDAANFDEFLDPENNQLSIGYDAEKKQMEPYHYGLLATEARATSFYGIGKGDLPKEHWWFIYRTLPEVRKQSQKPQGKQAEKMKVDYFQGYYTYKGKKFVPSWGGSLFEFLMPTLVMKERKLAPRGLGLNDKVATEIQRDYALKEKKYKVWGISPAGISNGRQWRYVNMGVKALGVTGYSDLAVVTPHVSFLALETLPADAIKNILKLLDYDTYGEYGFYDTVNVKTSKANPQYLALDQGMILVAICNYLKKGAIQERFHHDSVGKNAEFLLLEESFFNA